MNKKISLGAAITLLLVVAAFVFSVIYSYAQSAFNERVTDLRDRERTLGKYFEIDQLVRVNYYGEIDETQLTDSVAQGYLEGIGDKYSRYISAEEYKKMLQEEEGGDTVGIGADISISSDSFYLMVNEVYPDSPAEVAGIQAGDLIIQVDDTKLSRENSEQMLAAISGAQGSNVSVVIRRGSEESGPHTMTRRAVSVPTVRYARMLEDSTVGYLHIDQFRENTYDEFNSQLITLMDQGATALIIDLRDNSSDTLSYATRVLDKLLPEGTLVSASYKDGSTEVLATSDGNAIDLPVVVLTNTGTTGVSELFAQCIKDFEKGQTVGVTTAGNGMMQDILKLSDGSAIQLATAMYLTPSGGSIQDVGVKADYEVAMESDWTAWVDLEESDTQLMKAKEVALGIGGTLVTNTEESTSEADSSAAE